MTATGFPKLIDIVNMAVGILPVLVTLFVLVISLRKQIYRILRSRWYIAKLPGIGPTAFPVIGHAATLLAGTPVESFRKCRAAQLNFMKKHKGKLAVVWFGPIPVIWTFHPDACEVILRSSKHIEKSFIYGFLHCWLGTGLLTSKGEKWSQRRKLITPSFHFAILEDFLGIMNEQSRTLIQKLQRLKNRNAELLNCINMCTLDIICETAMGKSVNAQLKESEYVKALTIFTELLQKRMIAPWLWTDFVYNKTKDGIEVRNLLATLHGFTRSVIRDRINEKGSSERRSKNRLAFLDVLLDAETEDGEKLSFSGIQEEVDTFMFEGHDTTSAAMTWSLYLLGRHPEIQKKAQKEIDDVIGNRDVIDFSMDDLRKLEYLERVIKESLRIFPSVPTIVRVTSEDCVVDGYNVPEGTQVAVNPYNTHHNPNVWENPERFDPERFSKSNSLDRNPYAYIPFSAGPRNCIGQKFAIMEEKVILAQILRHYDVTSSTEAKKVELVGALVLRSNSTLQLSITERAT